MAKRKVKPFVDKHAPSSPGYDRYHEPIIHPPKQENGGLERMPATPPSKRRK